MQRIHESVWIAPGVQLYGSIEIGAESSLWPQAVIRAEARHVRVGRRTNLQDFVMVHVGYDDPTEIGDYCSVTHRAVIHGARIEDACLIGVGATIMDGAVIGEGSIVAPGAVVPPGTRFPPRSLIAGVPARLVRERDAHRENRLNAWHYVRNAAAYRRGDHRAWDGPEFLAWLAHTKERIEQDEDAEI